VSPPCALTRITGSMRLDANLRRPAEQRLHRRRPGDIDQLDVEIVFGKYSLIHRNPRNHRRTGDGTVGDAELGFGSSRDSFSMRKHEQQCDQKLCYEVSSHNFPWS
jgi:hypothetical protein